MKAGAPQGWRKERLHSWRTHTRYHVHWDPSQNSTSIGTWTTCTYATWRVSWGGGSWLYPTVGARRLVAETSGYSSQYELSWKSPHWHKDLAPSNSLQAPLLERLRPNNQQDRNIAPPSTHRLSKVILSSQPPQNTLPDTTQPTRRMRPSFTHQRAGTRSKRN